jgi:acyl-CoA hydrolase
LFHFAGHVTIPPRSLPGKPVSASAIDDQTAIVFPNDLNSLGTLFGGRVIERADLVAAVVAKRHAGRSCVTLSIDSVRFLASASHGDILVFKAAVNRVWTTSMEVGMKVYADDFHTMERKHIVSAYFTFVGVDENLNPTEIPPIIPETEDEKRRFREADERRELRLKKRLKG